MARKNRKRMTPGQRQVRRTRRIRRWLILPLQLSLLGVLGTGMGVAAYQVARYLRTSPALSIRSIEVRGAERTRVEDLLDASGLNEGMNIFAVNPEEVQRRLVDLPWIQKARALRVVPDRMVLEVEEQHPAAVINLGGLYYLNSAGEVFKRVQVGEEVDLPLLTGISREEFREEPDRAHQHIAESLKLLELIGVVPCLSKRRVAEVHFSELMGFSVVLDPGALSIRLARENPAKRLSALCRVLDEIQEQSLRAHAILFDHPGRSSWATVRLERKTLVAKETLLEKLNDKGVR